MTVMGKATGGSHTVAWTDVLGAGILMALVIVIGDVGLGLSVVQLLGLLGLPVDTDATAILRGLLPS